MGGGSVKVSDTRAKYRMGRPTNIGGRMNAMRDFKPLLNPGYTGHDRRAALNPHRLTAVENVLIWSWRVVASCAAIVFVLKVGGF